MNIIDTDSFQSEMTPVIICSGPHLDIEEWLKRLDLERYKGRISLQQISETCQLFKFKKNYFTEKFVKFYGVEELIHFSEGEIHRLGVKNGADRARMVSSLVALRAKKINIGKL